MSYCGLNLEEARKVVTITDTVGHALGEKDWDTERWKGLKESVEEIDKLAEKASKECVCPPHGLGDLDIKREIFKKCLQKEDAECANKQLKEIALCILGDI